MRERERIGLPPRVFLYTLDQVAAMLEAQVPYLKAHLLHYEGRSPGICPKDKMRCHNIAPEGETPEWRITENTFLGFLRRKGVKFYDRGYSS